MASYEFFRNFPDEVTYDVLAGKRASGMSGNGEGTWHQASPPVAPVAAGHAEKHGRADSLAKHMPSAVEQSNLSQGKKRACTALPFFGPGTMIKTRKGEIPVEWLDTSDHILTRDHGFQPILWVGRTEIPASYFRKNPAAGPVVLPAGALGSNCPARPLCIANGHRVLLRAPEAELAFLSSEVFAEALTWVQIGAAERVQPNEALTVTHIFMASHQIIMAEGAWVESLMATPDALCLPDVAELAQLEESLGTEIVTQQAARPCLTRKEAMMLLKRQSRKDAPAPDRNQPSMQR